MGAVSNILDFQERFQPATLVLVDLHGVSGLSETGDLGGGDFSSALENCRIALGCARKAGLPIAFVRRKPVPASLLSTRVYPSWLDGFRPYRSDMIFERALPSCYASMEFADMAGRCRELVIAGIFGETSCLSTLIEAHGRNHHFTFLADASASRGRAGISAEVMHKSVIGIASLYCNVSSTGAWTGSVSRKIGAAG